LKKPLGKFQKWKEKRKEIPGHPSGASGSGKNIPTEGTDEKKREKTKKLGGWVLKGNWGIKGGGSC